MIIEPVQRRALDFITAAVAGGYRPTAVEVEEWRLRPEPKPGDRGELLEAERRERVGPPGAIAQFLQGMESVQRTIAAGATAMRPMFDDGTRVIPAKYGPPGPAEGFIAHLLRLRWVEMDTRGGLGVTSLGRALMRSDDSTEERESAAIVLTAEDPLAYSRLIGRIVERDGRVVVDPYLRAPELFTLLSATEVDRVLVSGRLRKGEVAEMQTLVAGWPVRAGIELRVAAAGVLHDRYVLCHADVMMVGGSMNGIGRTLSTLVVDLPDVAAEPVRATVEGWWAEAESLAVSPGPDEVDEVDREVPDAEAGGQPGV